MFQIAAYTGLGTYGKSIYQLIRKEYYWTGITTTIVDSHTRNNVMLVLKSPANLHWVFTIVQSVPGNISLKEQDNQRVGGGNKI